MKSEDSKQAFYHVICVIVKGSCLLLRKNRGYKYLKAKCKRKYLEIRLEM
jgi:hypothetical protein